MAAALVYVLWPEPLAVDGAVVQAGSPLLIMGDLSGLEIVVELLSSEAAMVFASPRASSPGRPTAC